MDDSVLFSLVGMCHLMLVLCCNTVMNLLAIHRVGLYFVKSDKTLIHIYTKLKYNCGTYSLCDLLL